MPASLASPAALDARVAALDAAVSQLEAAERALRAAEAARFEAFARVFDVAAAGSGTGQRSVPTGRGGEILYRTVRAEAAAALRHSERTVERCFTRAHALTFSYPRTLLEALRDASISEQHAAVVVDAGTVIGSADDPDAVLRRAGYEEAVLEHARLETPHRLRPIARRIAEQYAQRPLDERHAEARKRRRVYLVDGEDGMSDLIAHLPAVVAHGVYAGLTAASREIERAQAAEAQAVEAAGTETPGAQGAGAVGAHAAPTDTRAGGACDSRGSRRSRDEIRADLFSDLLLSGISRVAEAGGDGVGDGDSGPGQSSRVTAPSARVQVVIPVECLGSPGLGLPHPDSPHLSSSAPASGTLGDPTAGPVPTLTGYGPIDTATARELAGLADTWERVHVSSGIRVGAGPGVGAGSGAGAVLAVERYRPSAGMRRYLAARDQHCRFPGCRVPVSRCDLDHTFDAAHGGPTATDNLAYLCRGHHTLKHHGGWHVTQRPDGALRWTSPTGRDHHDRPPGRVFFVPIPHAPPPDTPPTYASPRHISAPRTAVPRSRLRRPLATTAAGTGPDHDPPPF